MRDGFLILSWAHINSIWYTVDTQFIFSPLNKNPVLDQKKITLFLGRSVSIEGLKFNGISTLESKVIQQPIPNPLGSFTVSVRVNCPGHTGVFFPVR